MFNFFKAPKSEGISSLRHPTITNIEHGLHANASTDTTADARNEKDARSGGSLTMTGAQQLVESVATVLSTPMGKTHGNAREVFLACVCVGQQVTRGIMSLSSVKGGSTCSCVGRHRDVMLQYALRPEVLDSINMPDVAKAIVYTIGYKTLHNLY